MTVVSTVKDVERLTLTLVAEFDAPPERVWEVWEDPRQLERWWGPPTWPATFTRHDFVVGGESRYHLTGPAGEKQAGFWRMTAIHKPVRIDFLNGLAGQNGEPDPSVPPMAGFVTFEPLGGRTRMTAVTNFIDLSQMERMLAMGMAEGMAMAIGQVDALILADATSPGDPERTSPSST